MTFPTKSEISPVRVPLLGFDLGHAVGEDLRAEFSVWRPESSCAEAKRSGTIRNRLQVGEEMGGWIYYPPFSRFSDLQIIFRSEAGRLLVSISH